MRIDRRLVFLFALVIALAVPVVAFAADPAASHGEKGGHGNPGEFIDIHRYDLGIYTLIVFGLLFLILAKFAWGPFTQGLQKREADLVALRDAAKNAQIEAEAARARLNAEFAQANDKIRLMLEEARRDADDLRAREREVGTKEAAAERERAKREIQAAKDEALQDIYQQSVQLAAMMSSKALRRSMSADDHTRLVDESLAELKAGAGRN
jgi:F-type H+-transporting ATPase subunit b